MQVKDRVLAALEASRGTYLSGQALAQQLQVSRNAVWKAISQLRESGYPIQAVSHRGYCLDVDSPLLSPQSIARHLTVPGLQVEVAQTVSSTNTLLRQRAEEGAPEGLVLAAVEQTAGKGRQGPRFFSPPESFSIKVPCMERGKRNCSKRSAIDVVPTVVFTSSATSWRKFITRLLSSKPSIC